MVISNSAIARPLPSGLSASQQWTLLEWIHLAGQIETEAELRAFLDVIISQAPSEHIVLALGRVNQQQQIQRLERVLNVSYPVEWTEQYMKENYSQCDPILRIHLGQGPVSWNDRFSRAKGKDEKKFIAEASSVGLGDGLSFSAVSQRNNLGCIFSLSGSETIHDSNLVAMLDCLTPHLHQAAVRVANLPPATPSSMPLSQREYDIFHWMSRGKTNWEIATILDISERTVKFHVANVIRKLNANNRTHAIVLGMHLLPPPGLVVSGP
ncbi:MULTISPECIES: helix-turn-helix transcriptional regulator [Chromobacterium]|uniref:helix-turn-helix transcriptional regulator n=1 Tax=Chromobacterium TaxID=535 RepID=UPI000DEFC4DA|nr:MULTISPECIES: LuxR family transcriptional regulator [Chromobacterium]QOZ81625.1 LuxR family transcriptional regulator [Chromobacterium sp. Rain0013]WON85876.1 LuxR C-terminal-related transcriptional regulator [Chromobacterium haemolyticum]